MAFTVTRDKSVFGNKAVVMMKLVADAATDTIATGLSNITAFSDGVSSIATANFHIAVNKGISGTSIAGTIGVTGCAAGDEFYLIVYGTR